LIRFPSMKNTILLAALLSFAFLLPTESNAQFDKILKKGKEAITGAAGGATDAGNTGAGLKQALNFGVDLAVKQLSKDGGFLNSKYKILIPEDAQKVISVVKRVPGFQDVEERLVDLMNTAAESAVKEATPIFVSAIKQMTFADAKEILMGENNAATSYLQKTTNQKLYDSFLPVIQNNLDQINARKYWKTVVSAYNKVPLTKKMNPELDDHVNKKALSGLYSLIEKKEAGIRGDASQQTTQLLKDVFGKLKK